jgi:hypothetical protein
MEKAELLRLITEDADVRHAVCYIVTSALKNSAGIMRDAMEQELRYGLARMLARE